MSPHFEMALMTHASQKPIDQYSSWRKVNEEFFHDLPSQDPEVRPLYEVTLLEKADLEGYIS